MTDIRTTTIEKEDILSELECAVAQTDRLLERIEELEEERLALLGRVAECERSATALQESVAILHSTLETCADGVLIVDSEGRIVKSNTRFAAMWSIPPEVLQRGDDAEAIAYAVRAVEDPDGFMARVHELYADPAAESYDHVRLIDGRILERYSKPHIMSGEIRGRVWFFRDRTARYRLEAQLREAQKIEAVAKLSAGVAHDFNNLLTIIKGDAELLVEDLEARAAHLEPLQDILSAASRAAALTQQLQAFGRTLVMRPVQVDLNGTLLRLEPLFSRVIGEDISLTFSLNAARSIVVDAAQLEQVVMNVLLNSREAMPDGGRITIATEERSIRDADGREREYVALTITDTGIGIPPEIRARVFEPFFTTKGVGEGSGLGLPTVHGIVTQSGGMVEIESEVGVGTVVAIYLPASEEQVLAQPPLVAAAPRLQSRGTVLLVEDEESVRRLTSRILERRGYTVHAAANGHQALELVATIDGGVDLVLSDVVMPGMSGPELLARLDGVLPGAAFMLMSGYPGEEVARKGGIPPGVEFLQKPFTGTELIAGVSAALASRR